MRNGTLSLNHSGPSSHADQASAGRGGPADLDVLLASVASRFHPVDIPPEQWQGALAHRPLSPQEQAAREWYFEQRISQALARFRASRNRTPELAGRR
jgi:hypothetical protein